MVPPEFTAYFTAAAAAAGVLIGLLFVAVSLRPEAVFGEGAPADGRAQAGSAFTALVNSFFVSLVALIPQSTLGKIAIIMALVSLLGTVQLHHRLAREELHMVLLFLSMGTYLFQLVVGILLTISPGDRNYVYDLTYVGIAAFAVALSRAWALVQGKHLRSTRAGRNRQHNEPVDNSVRDGSGDGSIGADR
ncbi:MAG TPA: hypothetical protein VGH85_05325 [Mycobacteriales bacterium]|jgi:hypothetical protein